MGERASLLPEKNVWESTAPPLRRSWRKGEGLGSRGAGEDGGRSLRRDVWTILRFRASIPHCSSLLRASYAVEVCVLVLILLNVLLAMRESAFMSGSSADSFIHTKWYDSFLYVSTMIFSVEYVLRLWSCVEDERFQIPVIGRIKWMLRPMSIIDLVVLLPFYLEILFDHGVTNTFRGVVTLRGLRLLRIMSFLRLERSYNALKNLRELFTQKREELLVVSYLTAVVVVTGSTTIFFLENPTQPDVFSSIGVCMWWSIETITSLGYGDIVPVTGSGRFFSSILALWGIILFTIPGAILSSGYVEIMLKKHETIKQARFEEDLRRTFSRELEALSSSGFKRGHLHSSDEDSPPRAEKAHQITEKQFLLFQQQFEQLTSLQHQVQAQLRAQKAQLDAIQRLIEVAPRPSKASEKPPFSAIAVPPEQR